MWPVIFATIVSTFVGTVFGRWLDTKLPLSPSPPSTPPAPPFPASSGPVIPGDFVLVQNAFKNTLLIPNNGDRVTPLRMQVTELLEDSIMAVFRDPRFPDPELKFITSGARVVPKSDVLTKTA